MARQYPLVVVTWKDAKSDPKWQPLKQAEENTLCELKTAGWLIYSNKERVVVASEMGDEADCSHRHIIPRNWITKLERMQPESSGGSHASKSN